MGFGPAVPICSFYGVTCTGSSLYDGLRISLRGNGLRGKLPESLGVLSMIHHLFLDSNELGGSLPSSIGNLTGMKEFMLENNSFTGEIPSSISTMGSEAIYPGGRQTGLDYLILDMNR